MSTLFVLGVSYSLMQKFRKFESKEQQLDRMHNDNCFNQIHEELEASIQIPSDDSELTKKKQMDLPK